MASESGASISYNDCVTSNDSHVTKEDDHVTPIHQWQQQQLQWEELRDEEESEDDTAGEEGDTLPPDSTSTATTDAVNDPLDPIDFIETHPHDHTHCFNGGGAVKPGTGRSMLPGSHYDGWNLLEVMQGDVKKGKPVKRMKAPRAGAKPERLRTPYLLPRAAGKTKYPRPSPSSRKRRLSGRMMRPAQPANASEEGDMAQADEMGEGEGRDDGFVEGVDPISRRRNKKRPGGIHMLLPPPGGGSPPSSPSNTPVTRRRTSSRKSRLKPRSKKQSKPQLAPADLSTQESTTQGPGSSESSDEVTSPDGETTPLRTAGEDILEEEGEESRSLTPNPKDPSTLSVTHHHHHKEPPPPRPPPPFSSRRLDHVSDIHNHAPNSLLGRLASASKDGLQSNSDDNLVVDSNGTSDTDQHHSLNLPSPGKGERWTSRKFESDLSTAPFSSETSDMDTSGNERVVTTDSVVDVSSNPSPPLGKRVQVKSAVAGGRGGGGSGLRSPARPGSGSSGDERSSKKRQSKKSITIASSSSSSLGISKPLPPPVPKKVPLPAKSEKGQSSGPSGGGSASRRQLQHTKSNPLANHRVVSQSHDNTGTGGGAGSSSKPRSSVTSSPSRSLSTKPNMIARPKPPVGTKPKPAPPPKPMPTKIPSKPPPPKPAANHRAASSTGGGQSTVTKPRSHSHTEGDKLATQVGKGELRKGQSVDSVTEVTVSPSSPPTAARSKNPALKKPIKTVGGAEKGKEGSVKQNGGGSSGPTSSSKPSVASKPRRLSSEKRPHLVKSGSTLTKKDIVVVKNVSSPQISDSSKNPSSSEATSGLSQSPTNSPYPSPSLLHKKPSPPSAKPNKPSPILAKKISSPLLPNAATKPTKTSPKLVKKVGSPVLPTPASKILGGVPGGLPSSKSKPELSSTAKPELSPATSRSKPEISPTASKSKTAAASKPKPEISPAASKSKSPATSKAKPEAPSKVKPELSPILLKTKPEISPASKSKPVVPSATGSTKKGDKEERDGGEQPVLFSISEGSLSDSITSPSPPPIPARNYLTNSSHDSSGLQDDSYLSSPPPIGGLRGTDVAKSPRLQTISSDATPPSPRPRSRQGGGGPRRPPPNPPATPPMILTSQSVTLSTSSLPTTEFGRRLPPRSKSYDVIEDAAKKTSNTEEYFGSHQSRETVEDVSYAVVKRSSLRRNQQNGEESASSGNTSSPKPSSGKEDSVGGRSPKPVSRRPPPKSPSNVYESIDEVRKPFRRQMTDKGHQLLTHKHSFSPPPPDDSDVPPPLPSRPAPRLTPNLASTNSSSSPNLLEPASYEGLVLVKDSKSQPLKATRDPVYDVIPDNFKKKPPRPKRNYEEIILPEFEGDVPRLWVPSPSEGGTTEKPPPPLPSRSESSSPAPPLPERREFSPNPPEKRDSMTPSITMVTRKEGVVSRLASASSETKMLALEDLRENWTAPDVFPKAERRASSSGTLPEFRKRQAKSFSGKRRQSLMFKRNSSERYGKQKARTFDSAASNKGLVRAGSLDRLNLRMEQSVRNSIHHTGSSSEDEEEATTSVSPTTTTEGLPQIPNDSSLYKVPKTNKKALNSNNPPQQTEPAGPFLCPPDVEPLYQYINTAEFLREREPRPQSGAGSAPSEYGPGGEGGKKQNQLELARQLSMRKLWCELPEVIKSGVLDTLTSEERKLQEAIFEVISSEDSYLRSLDVLINHFMNDPGMNPHLPEGRRVIDKRQHHVIFSNVKEVRDVSALFLEKLHARQRESAVVRNISDIILDFSDNYFDCYVRYCTNQVYQIREMQDMISNPSNVMFRDYLHRLESDKICQSLNIQSFLLLPMQRITRLPLLILAILNRTPLDHPDHDLVEKTLRSVQKLVTECNDGARKMDRTEQLHEIHKKLDFGKMKPFPIVSLSRQLERRGILMRLQVEQKLLGKTKIKKKPLYLFIFTDYVIITKRKKDPKGDYTYRVKDYASKAVVEVEGLDYHPGVSFPKFGEQNPISKATYAVSTANAKHAFMMVFLDNASHKEGNYIFLAQNDTDKTRWMECLNRPDQKDDEKIYQHWDCPQVQAVYDYKSQQPDELDLDRGDVVKVYRKMADGWYEGERLRDMMWGWFPSNFTVEIENAHTRARNLRQTHKLNCTSSSALALMQSQP